MKLSSWFARAKASGVASPDTFYVALIIAALLLVGGTTWLWSLETPLTVTGAGTIVNWAYTVLTGLLVFVVFAQVREARKSAKESLDDSDWQRRKWATLQACDRYDIDPELAHAVRYLRKYHWYTGPRLLPPGTTPAEPRAIPVARTELTPERAGDALTADQEYTLAAGKLLNYFDSIAIGLKQKFYVKEICEEHIGPIFVRWMHDLRSVNPETFDKQMSANFERLPELLQDWDRR